MWCRSSPQCGFSCASCIPFSVSLLYCPTLPPFPPRSILIYVLYFSRLLTRHETTSRAHFFCEKYCTVCVSVCSFMNHECSRGRAPQHSRQREPTYSHSVLYRAESMLRAVCWTSVACCTARKVCFTCLAHNCRRDSVVLDVPDTVGEQTSALSQQNPSTSTHEKCVPSVSKNPDLDQVVVAWDDLPDQIKAQILELVKTST